MKAKKRTLAALQILLAIMLICTFGFVAFYSNETRASASSPFAREGEEVAYAAALASLEENDAKNKEEMLVKARRFINERDVLFEKSQAYLVKNGEKLAAAEKAYEELSSQSGNSSLTAEEFETEMTEEHKRIIAESNAFLVEVDAQYQKLEQKHKINGLPVLYYSIEELKGGLEESLVILEDFGHLLADGREPSTTGYTREDFYRLYEERIQAETEVLEKLKADPDPDLYTYSLLLYKERAAHPVIT